MTERREYEASVEPTLVYDGPNRPPRVSNVAVPKHAILAAVSAVTPEDLVQHAVRVLLAALEPDYLTERIRVNIEPPQGADKAGNTVAAGHVLVRVVAFKKEDA